MPGVSESTCAANKETALSSTSPKEAALSSTLREETLLRRGNNQRNKSSC